MSIHTTGQQNFFVAQYKAMGKSGGVAYSGAERSRSQSAGWITAAIDAGRFTSYGRAVASDTPSHKSAEPA